MSKRLDEFGEVIGKRLEEINLLREMEDLDSDQAILGVSMAQGESYDLDGFAPRVLLGIDLSWANHLNNLRRGEYSYSPVVFNSDIGVIYHELQRNGVVNLVNEKIRTRSLACDYVIKRGTTYVHTRVLGFRIPDSSLRRLVCGSRYKPVRHA